MKPAALRGQRHVDDHPFRVYAQLLAERLHQGESAPFDQLLSFLIWVRAIAQHYGPGTEFLDVTRSLDVAVWFALNVAERVPVQSVFGEPGPIDPARDTPASFQGLRFRPNDEVGYVHVFDVPVWNPGEPLSHGMLVDLATAPEVFASSPRLQVQDACLLYADPGVDSGDLKLFAKTSAVSRPMADCASLQRLAAELFPDPTIDPWYRRLLSVPLVHRLGAGSPSLELAQAVPVELYVDAKSWLETSERLILLPPPILWPEIQQELKAPESWVPAGFNPAGATPILVELPIFIMTPELEGGQWHHRILARGIPTHAPAIDAVTGEELTVDLTRVLVEFSPLEFSRWDEVETTNDELIFARGAYVEREGDTYRLWWISQSFPGCQRTVAGPFPFFLDSAQGQLLAGTTEHALPLQWPAKTLLVVLTLLRELSTEPLLCPFPTRAYDETVFVVRVQGQTARLVRATTRAGEHLYLLRHPTRDEPFSGNTNDAGVVIARSDTGWLGVDPESATQALLSGTRRDSAAPVDDELMTSS